MPLAIAVKEGEVERKEEDRVNFIDPIK